MAQAREIRGICVDEGNGEIPASDLLGYAVGSWTHAS